MMKAAGNYTTGYWSERNSEGGELHLILNAEEIEFLLNAKEAVDFQLSESPYPSLTLRETWEWFKQLADFVKEKWGE